MKVNKDKILKRKTTNKEGQKSGAAAIQRKILGFAMLAKNEWKENEEE